MPTVRHYLLPVYFVLIIFLFCDNPVLHAQDSGFTCLYSTDETEYAPEHWKAKWIWMPGVSNHDLNHYMLARKTFTIKKVPAEARLYITADSHYKLWISGKYVVRGPARCSPLHQSYDILNVRDLPPLMETDVDAFKVWKLMEAPQYSKYKTWGDWRMHDALHHSMQDVDQPGSMSGYRKRNLRNSRYAK